MLIAVCSTASTRVKVKYAGWEVREPVARARWLIIESHRIKFVCGFRSW